MGRPHCAFVTNSLQKFGSYSHLLVRSSVVLFDGFMWTIALNSSSLLDLECVKVLLTQKDESETRDMVMRANEEFKIRHDASKVGNCSWGSFDEYGMVERGICCRWNTWSRLCMRRCKFVSSHKFKLPSGEAVDLCPVMTDDEKRRFEECGYRFTEVEGRPETKQRWPLMEIDLGDDMPHPNKGKPWAFPADDTQPPPPPMNR